MIDKKELKRQYKQTLPPMGIYQVKNLANGKMLIGSSPNLPGKFNSLRFQLEQGACMNKELQADFVQFGKEKFSFEVLDTLEPKEDLAYDYRGDLSLLEEMWLEKLQPYDGKGYNTRKRVR